MNTYLLVYLFSNILLFPSAVVLGYLNALNQINLVRYWQTAPFIEYIAFMLLEQTKKYRIDYLKLTLFVSFPVLFVLYWITRYIVFNVEIRK